MSGPSRSSIFWTGFNDIGRGGEFVWTTGEPVTYTNWHPGEPNNYRTRPPSGRHVAMNWWYGLNDGNLADRRLERYHQRRITGGRIWDHRADPRSPPVPGWPRRARTPSAIAAGAIKDVQGTPIQAYNGTFTLD